MFKGNQIDLREWLYSVFCLHLLTNLKAFVSYSDDYINLFDTCEKQPPQVFCKKGVLRDFAKFTGKHLCYSPFLNKIAGMACNFIKKETLTRVFSCEFCEITKNTFSERTRPVAASHMFSHYIKRSKTFDLRRM